jgi:hypothetical protein
LQVQAGGLLLVSSETLLTDLQEALKQASDIDN